MLTGSNEAAEVSRQTHLQDLTCLTKKQFQEGRMLQMY